MNWNKSTPMQKVALVIACIAVLIKVVFEMKPDLFPIDPTYPAIAVFTVCEAVACWKEKRKWAYVMIAGAVVSMAFFILELCLL